MSAVDAATAAAAPVREEEKTACVSAEGTMYCALLLLAAASNVSHNKFSRRKMMSDYYRAKIDYR